MNFKITRVVRDYSNKEGAEKTFEDLNRIVFWYKIIGSNKAHQKIVVKKEDIDKDFDITDMRNIVKEKLEKEEVTKRIKDDSLEEDEESTDETESLNEEESLEEEEEF